MPEEFILTRDRVACLINELKRAIECPDVYQVKLRAEGDYLTIVPHFKPIEIALQ